ncbi:uncharacterized protein V2V93DRAFT_367662 [Kockiozyma suomiensis]|uniref:uncharacterized protein n=1 Tax=Kockiozyma suomiensis TaxID=1337062 RepID=UPI0033433B8E
MDAALQDPQQRMALDENSSGSGQTAPPSDLQTSGLLPDTIGYLAKFRVSEIAVTSRVWTDADIMVLIDAYTRCKHEAMAARKTAVLASTPSDHLFPSHGRAASEKSETSEELFDRVHAEFVKHAVNPHRTPKSLHEKFGFLTITYRRIKEFQMGRIENAPCGTNWWDMRVKEQRKYLTKSMTPISFAVYQAIEPVVSLIDAQKSILLSTSSSSTSGSPRIPVTPVSLDLSDLSLLQNFSASPQKHNSDKGSLHVRTASAPMGLSNSSRNVPMSPAMTAIDSRNSVPLSPYQPSSYRKQAQHQSLNYENTFLSPQYAQRVQLARSKSTIHQQRQHILQSQNIMLSQDMHQQQQSSIQSQGRQSPVRQQQRSGFDHEMEFQDEPSLADSQLRMTYHSQNMGESLPLQNLTNEDIMAAKRRRVNNNAHNAISVPDEKLQADFPYNIQDGLQYMQHDDLASVCSESTSQQDAQVLLPQQLHYQLPVYSASQAQPTQVLQEFMTIYKQLMEGQRRRDEQILEVLNSISSMTKDICQIVQKKRNFDTAME